MRVPLTPGTFRPDFGKISAAITQSIPYYTTVDGAQAAIGGIEALLKGEISVQSLQEYHAAP